MAQHRGEHATNVLEADVVAPFEQGPQLRGERDGLRPTRTRTPAEQLPGGLNRVRPFAKPVPDRRVALAWRKSFARPAAIEALKQQLKALDLPVQIIEATKSS